MGVRQEGLSVGGQRNLAMGAVEKLQPELPLQAGNLLADGGLDDAQLVRGPSEVAQLGDGDEVPQLTQLHLAS